MLWARKESALALGLDPSLTGVKLVSALGTVDKRRTPCSGADPAAIL